MAVSDIRKYHYGYNKDNDNEVNNNVIINTLFINEVDENSIIIDRDNILELGPQKTMKLLTNANVEYTFAKCNCTHLKGLQNIGAKCPYCEARVSLKETNVLLKLDIPALNPTVYGLLLKTIYKKDFIKIIKRQKVKSNLSNVVEEVLGVELNYISLMENFKDILRLGMSMCKKTQLDKPTRIIFMMLLKYYSKDSRYIFDDVMLIPPSLFMTLNKGKGFKQLATVSDIINIIYQTEDDVRMVTNIIKSCANGIGPVSDIVNKKKGIVRHSIDGGRGTHTLYLTLTQNTGKTDMETVYLPYIPMVNLFRELIVHHLMKTMDYRQADHIIWESLTVGYNPIVGEILDKITDMGFTATPQRPPLLHSGSLLTLDMKIKKDFKDKTISLSPLLFLSMNADTDGDNLLVSINVYKSLIEMSEQFRYYNFVMIGDGGEAYSKFAPSKTINHNIANLVNGETYG